MKKLLAVCLALTGCSSSSFVSISDAGLDATDEVETGVQKELVCGENFCGNIVDKTTGATADCGSCQGYNQCGDNGISNVCGSYCLPLTAPDGDGGIYTVTPACTYALGPGWWAGYATGGLQFFSACHYMDPNNCALINNPWPSNGECAGTVCGNWYCCLNDPDAGINPLLPGAVANNDGGLP